MFFHFYKMETILIALFIKHTLFKQDIISLKKQTEAHLKALKQ